MLSAIDVFTKFVNSPGGVLTAGAVLAGIVWKFFERVEAVLTEQTKFEIAVWLLDRKQLSPRLQQWPDTFLTIFNRVFGSKHFSLKCFCRSTIASFILATLGNLLAIFLLDKTSNMHWGGVYGPITWQQMFYSQWHQSLRFIVLVIVLGNYIALLETRIVLSIMRVVRSQAILMLLLIFDLIITASGPVFMYGAFHFFGVGLTPESKESMALAGLLKNANYAELEMLNAIHGYDRFWVLYPALFTSVWLWLYAGSGFLLKFARRFDLGFDWFNRKFDIEKHPLQSIGLIAGATIAVVYWSAVGTGRLL